MDMKLAMTQSLMQELKMKLALLCAICGKEWEDHEKNCPFYHIDELSKSILHIKCHVCFEHAIDVNDGDFYECRKCHTQYDAGIAYTTKADKLVLLDPPTGDLIPCRIMPDKGEGRFPKDKRIKEWYDVAHEMLKVLKRAKIYRGGRTK